MAMKSGTAVLRHGETWQECARDGQCSNENAESGKTTIRCKCPRCGDNHNVLIRWVGRGVPRIYCRNCRPLVAAVSEVRFNGGAWCNSKSGRKAGHFSME